MREAVLAAFADCALSEIRDFGESATTLAEAARNHELRLTAETQTAAQAAWEAAIDRWQVLELFQFGPAAMSSLPGGQDIRSEIYIWPQFNRCLIEQIMVNRVYLADNFSEQFANARGFGALEYTLFYAAEDNVCPLSNPINSGGTWASLVAEGLGAAKAGYARAVAEDVQRNAAALVVAWDPTQGGFWNELAHAGRGSTVYPTTQAALNALSDALFYLDTDVKDMKLGAPIGLAVPGCGASICPDLVESSFAGRSRIHVKNNLLGFRKLFSGCADGEGLGFDDLLADLGQSGLADRMTQEIADAIGAVDAIEEASIQDALRTDLESVQRLHAAVKDITDLFKTDFFTILNLDPPAGAGTDND